MVSKNVLESIRGFTPYLRSIYCHFSMNDIEPVLANRIAEVGMKLTRLLIALQKTYYDKIVITQDDYEKYDIVWLRYVALYNEFIFQFQHDDEISIESHVKKLKDFRKKPNEILTKYYNLLVFIGFVREF